MSMVRDYGRKGRTFLSQKETLEVLRRKGSVLAFMHDTSSPSGKSYFVLAGEGGRSGRVALEVAEGILKRPDVVAGNDGLLPGHDQTWTLWM